MNQTFPYFVVGDNYQNPEGWETAAPNAGNPADYMRVVVEYDHAFLTPLVGPQCCLEEVEPSVCELKARTAMNSLTY